MEEKHNQVCLGDCEYFKFCQFIEEDDTFETIEMICTHPYRSCFDELERRLAVLMED